MDIKQRLGRNLRRLRLEMNVSQEAFADIVDLHRTYVSDIERGQRNPTVEVLERIAKALKTDAGRLLD